MWIESVRRAPLAGDAPARRRRRCGRSARRGQHEAGGGVALGTQGEAASRRRGKIVENADDDGQRTRAEPLLERPERILTPRRLDQNEVLGCEPETGKTRSMEPAQLSRRIARHAAEHRHPIGRHGRMHEPAAQKAQHKSEGRGTITRMAAARCRERRLHLMDACACEAIGAEAAIHRIVTEAPERWCGRTARQRFPDR